MSGDFQSLDVLRRHGVPFVIIGGHAVSFHGYLRVTEDVELLWIRTPASEHALFNALTELEAHYIGSQIDPATGLEQTHPVTLAFIQASHLMMLLTSAGFVDLFDHAPGLPDLDPAELLASSIESGGLRYVALDPLRRMKIASGRAKDKLDLENLPESK